MVALAALAGLVAEATMVEQTVAVVRAVAVAVGVGWQVAEGGCKSPLACALGETMGRADP